MTENMPVGCLGAILRLLGIRPRETELVTAANELSEYPYLQRDDFLSLAEFSFFRALQQVLIDQAVICPKVRLADIFFVGKSPHSQSHWNRINQKHIDFLVCTPSTMKPVCGIELDDSSHLRDARKRRDDFVEQVFEAASLPLVRIPVAKAYSTKQLKDIFQKFLAQGPTEPREFKATGVPVCAKCGVSMVLRTATRGSSEGQQFYGCQNYPKCREVVRI